MGTGTSSFDWVRARANCSLAVAFKQLQLGVEHDVEAINAQRHPDDQYKFSVAPSPVSADQFSVVLEGGIPTPRPKQTYLKF
jgi:hypothetical protein